MGRPPDPVWDALETHFGPVTNDAERGLRNQAVKLLRQSEATPEQIGIAYEWCRKSFTVFTEVAVAKYFSRSLHEWSQPTVSPLSIVRRMAEDG